MSSNIKQLDQMTPEEKRAMLAQLMQKKNGDVKTAPVSFAQQRLWFVEQLYQDSPMNNVPLVLRLRGFLDLKALEWSLQEIVNRQAVFRTTFAAVEGRPVQRIHPPKPFALPLIDLSGLPEGEREAEAERLMTEEAARTFDLGRDLLFRASVIREEDEEHRLMLTMHHIATDGWSRGVLLKELIHFYRARTQGVEVQLPELEVSYVDFAVWQRDHLKDDHLYGMLGYWKDHLAGAPALLDLPLDRPRPGKESFSGGQVRMQGSAGLLQRLKELSRREEATLFMTLLAAYYTLLCRYNRQESIVIGTPVANRTRQEQEGLIGFFVNMLPLHLDLSGDPTFCELLQRTKKAALGAFAHQDLPFERLVEELDVERNLNQSPLFQTTFTLQNAPSTALELPGLVLDVFEQTNGTAKFDLSLFLWEADGGLAGGFEYKTDLFEAGTVERLSHHYLTLLESIVNAPDSRISELPIMTAQERAHLVQLGETETVSVRDELLHQLFEEQVLRTPDHPALVFEGRTMSYRELNERANRVAHHLKAQGLGRCQLAAIFMERSFEMVVAVFGVLKAGAAYLPLDPDYPAERLQFMLDDSEARFVLTMEALAGNMPANQAKLLCLDRDWAEIARSNADNPEGGALPSDPAYVIYTSGSTGRPKGVVTAHRGICNTIRWYHDDFPMTTEDAQVLKSPFSFDASVTEFFVPLSLGARIVIARQGAHRDPGYLAGLMAHEQVTVIQVVPTQLQMLLDEPRFAECVHLRQVYCGAELMTTSLLERFHVASEADLINMYGPTEVSVECTYWFCERGDERHAIPIGRPIPRMHLYVLDERLEPVPIGAVGEIYIGGIGVGLGYLNRPELTAERFLQSPFAAAGSGERLYKTGDLARWNAEGALEIIGRADHQVKIRGHRVELSEIENLVHEADGVRNAVALAREVEGDTRLIVYITLDKNIANPFEAEAPGEETPARQLALSLQQRFKELLPAFMVPSAVIPLEEMPLLPSGKINHNQLPEPKIERNTHIEFVMPQSESEVLIAAIWREVLKVDQVGLHDNFFDLGGHSLLVIQVHTKLCRELNRDIALVEMFQHPTVYALAKLLSAPENHDSRDSLSMQQAELAAEARSDAMQRRKEGRQQRRDARQ
ncbi:hypothetical protein CIG75_10640 [Tumebacillus algifaecis]|uniref:Carrier domain-containing protein n=1 Tax=Tumebacillus algifaecis TaxID=1214604 RepID=A0A223D1D5_9BACL|nr:non-ribosomal peptide synthetase [Tumebacillus algifaecis]ASS75402.1 hypothetical protein CIG75_10640 [Tumebacillus algifaecis]